ncbi:MAG: precorrin-2 dehydrogenase/sirohydrochlorin ferrochelatase family protein [Planctomycetota bacterium]|jgi:precorrin-2 dehydrogenase/sirohydrochlorin ferrochelatase
MAKFPIYLEMSNRRAVVIGAGAVAARKVKVLHEAGARVTVIAEHVKPSLEEAFQLPDVELVLCAYHKNYLVGATLVFAATNDDVLNRQVYHDCQELEILCNAVDQPHLCDFYTPAIVKRGDLQIAIGTDGNCPAYSGHIRRKLEDVFTELHGEFVDHLEKKRQHVLQAISDANQRKVILGQLASDESFEIFRQEGSGPWSEYAHQLITQNDNH